MADSIYLNKLIDKNIGPLDNVCINFPFFDNGNPKPVVLVGENGTGKSTILSNIVDAFFEMAGEAFTNVRHSSEGNGYQYFKTVSPNEIHTGNSHLYSFISFKAEGNPKYVFKSGKISSNELKKQIGETSLNFSCGENDNKKQVFVNNEKISSIWNNNVICYYGPERYEKPAWMGDKYFQTENYMHPSVKNNYSGILKNPIIVRDVTSPNLQWILDVIADSRADIDGDLSSMRLSPTTNINNLFLLKQARNNLETILSKILCDDVYFQLNYRNKGGSRFRIVRKEDNSIVCPTLDSLSTGQIALFNMFATIVKYADNNNIDKSINLSDITGIVVIDEIELHLHSKLQKEVLPELIKLFPKIQFIITSHAPLFLLGMEESFGEDCFEILEMPKAEKISAECFSEFLNAYNYISKTEQFKKEVEEFANTIPAGDNPLIITEGSTDWKHIKTALCVLSSKEEYKELFKGLEIDFLEYEPANSSSAVSLKIEMGNEALLPLCESLKKIPHERKYIILADRDTPKIIQKLVDNGNDYKKWGNNTFSAILPLPTNRDDTPEICIEHYYTDAEIEKEIDINGIKRHLFMGKDFNSMGYNCELDCICERKELCGPGKINIIDGTKGEKVRKLSDESDTTNYAISKSGFADYVRMHTDEFDFSNFIQLFELIKTIIAEGAENA